jgi:hypothetical protein
MMKIGDRFKDKTAGKIYVIRMETDNDMSSYHCPLKIPT